MTMVLQPKRSWTDDAAAVFASPQLASNGVHGQQRSSGRAPVGPNA
jgi:hypothetical protein